MTGGQIAALIFGIILLIPGGCFLVVGITMLRDPLMSDLSPWLMIIGVVILYGASVLIRKRKPPAPPA